MKLNIKPFHLIRSTILFSIVFLFTCNTPQKPASLGICFNSLGFLPELKKTAVITKKCSVFYVKKSADNSIAYEGNVSGPYNQEDVKQEVWIADFSPLKEEGSYYLEVPEVGKTPEFSISKKVFNQAFSTSMKAFYLWRCGTSVQAEYQGNVYSQNICHMDDGYLDYLGLKDQRKDGTKGWHDAGDYGKYVVNAGATVGLLFYAWEHFKDNIESQNINIPDENPDLPEFLEEMKWETDWLLKMQYSDSSGRVSHKLTRLKFSDFIMPDADKEKRYFSEWSSAATANFAAQMAMAARYFAPYDTEYAKTCLIAAKRSYRFLKDHPEEKRWVQGDFQTGAYGSDDADDRLWAAAELWETTGEMSYLEDFEKSVKSFDTKQDGDWDWPNLKNLGVFTYIQSDRSGKDPEIEAYVKKSILETADEIVEISNNDIYGKPMKRNYWGCNGTIARLCLNLQIAHKLSPDSKYIDTAVNAIDHLLGKNYYGRSYITGIGVNPPMNPHDRRSGADDVKDPWPGYIVGGGQTATGWYDEEGSYSTNEIAINWQGAWVYALAGFCE